MAEDETPEVQQLPEIIVLGPPVVFETYEKEFCSKFRILRPWESTLPLSEFLLAHAQNTNAALCSGYFLLSTAVLRHLPSLRLVVTTSAGVDHIDLSECRRRQISVANASTLFSADVADLAVGLLLNVMRQISAANRLVKNGLWPKTGDYPFGSKLGGKKVGIVGLGSIGLEVAKRLEAFGCIISYHSREKKSFVLYPFYRDILELAAISDVLVICCALTKQTRHLIDREVLLALGKKGFIVNIARGPIIDENELVLCLQQGLIAGAGLEVFENEPHVPEALFSLNNVVLSPHSAAFTMESLWDSYEITSGNLEAFFSNKPLLSPVLDK
ncbi:D-isomer specific 2-hydroxyacid dehydrogenase family protein [Forsythia ovata]|uniref:D-isomer specific 2-hydroxyacid dehydrogenase family protein n=1 Tax=Forsythia ovata TaxID=205694 RepID=A0ABD1TRB6_9LAMI